MNYITPLPSNEAAIVEAAISTGELDKLPASLRSAEVLSATKGGDVEQDDGLRFRQPSLLMLAAAKGQLRAVEGLSSEHLALAEPRVMDLALGNGHFASIPVECLTEDLLYCDGPNRIPPAQSLLDIGEFGAIPQHLLIPERLLEVAGSGDSVFRRAIQSGNGHAIPVGLFCRSKQHYDSAVAALEEILEESWTAEEVKASAGDYAKALARAYVETRMSRLVYERGAPTVTHQSTQQVPPETRSRGMLL